MKRNNKERIHLCPICQIVKMEFLERIKSNNHMRMRRFICPICEFQEMYLCEGPDDIKIRENQKDREDNKRIIEQLDKVRNES